MPMDVGCLESVVKNISGSTKSFGFLPPHGRTLANNGTVTYFGDLFANIAASGRASNRKLAALKTAIENEELTIVRQPFPVVYDEGVDDTRILKSHNNSVVSDGPCWESDE